ncbi:MAG: lamin tail domain-containing protein, partial [Planctomycetota bacterium]|nr:lamin tail domain-containing protein [Planctomycetota bacterium]
MMSQVLRKSGFPALLVFLGAISQVAAQDVIISELMAVNNGTIEDEDGNTPDWIELFNAGNSTQNLSGYYLSDDPLVPEKWRFPSVSIAPGGFLVVFASDKDRRDAGSELHTNFKLSSSGEFLGLFASDGETIVDQVAPFPELIAGFSYGISQNARQVGLVGSEVPARALVPTNGNLGMTWMEPGFDDSAWLSGETGVGYDRNATYRGLINLDVEDQMRGENLACFIRI